MMDEPPIGHAELQAFFGFLARWLSTVDPDNRKRILDDMRRSIDHLDAHAADDRERDYWLRARRGYFGLRSLVAAAQGEELP